MKKVKCINNDGCEKQLTIGAMYEVIKVEYNRDNSNFNALGTYYTIIDNNGNEKTFDRFKFLGNDFIFNTETPTNPTHYHTKIQPIEYIEANNLGFHEGNVIKYITRYKEKNGIEDLEKAKTYIEMLIEKLKRENI